MRGCLIVAGVIVVGLLLLGGCGVSQYNGLVDRSEGVDARFSEIQNQYKRRYDLIPQLVETVRGAADFEQETLTRVIEARQQVTNIQVPESVAKNPEAATEFLRAQDGLTSALQRLLVTVERYPQLTATAGFRDLQAQIEGTENRIAVARGDYIREVQGYNAARRRFPTNLFANVLGFDPVPQLEAEPGVEERPTIDFGNR